MTAGITTALRAPALGLRFGLRFGLGLALAVLGGPLLAGAVELRGHGGPVRALQADGEGRVLSGSFDTRAILWDAETGTALEVMRLHEGGVTALAFLPDGRLATGGQDGRIGLWRRGESDPERVIEAHEGPVTALAVSPDGALLGSSAWDRTARLTPLGDGQAVVLDGHDDNVNGIGFLADGRIVTAAYDGQVRFWTQAGRAAGAVATGAPLNALAVDEAGHVWVAAADGSLRVFDAQGAALAQVAAGDAPLVSLAVSPDLAAAGGLDGGVIVVDTATLAVRQVIAAASGPVWALALRDGGELLVGGADHVVRPWDAATGIAHGETREAALAEAYGESRGAQVFRMCGACHTLGPDDGNRAGPTLHGIFGRPIASSEGFHYSPALREMDLVWTPETVARLFEIGPAEMTPGTSMPEQRIPDPADRAALIEFLEEHTRVE